MSKKSYAALRAEFSWDHVYAQCDWNPYEKFPTGTDNRVAFRRQNSPSYFYNVTHSPATSTKWYDFCKLNTGAETILVGTRRRL